jgi:hypothetical protein
VEGRLYRIDAALAALADREVETRWRQALASGERGTIIVLARQLVLRALPVIEQTCLLRAERAGLERCECERAIEESSIKLLLRLLHDGRWSSVGALAAGIATKCLDQPGRRREAMGLAPLRPRLHLVAGAGMSQAPRGRQQERGDDHGCC